MLLLLTWLTFNEVLPEDGLLLQTYSTDNIGRQNFFFSLGSAGISFQTLGYKESTILSLKQKEIRIAVPFWIRFFDEYFHFYSLPKMVFNHPFCNFMPQQMKFDPIEVFTVKNAQLYIQNMRLNENMIINEILTNSKNIFIPQLQIVRVMPGNVVLYSIYICPTEPGNFQDIIFIKTNFGTIPYSITYQAYLNQDDSLTPVLIHHYTQDEINISITIPNEIIDLKKSVIFDSSIFDSSKILIKKNNIFISSKNIVTSSYITFVHILTSNLKYTFPLTILSSPKPLQHIHPIILIPPITQKENSVEVDIVIVNPTDISYEITSISLKENPSNIKIEKLMQPIIAIKNAQTVVGRIIAVGEKEGELTGSVHIDYINRQIPIKYDMLIPIKGCCFFGYLTFSEKDIYLLSNSSKKFSMVNNFSVPIIIYEIKPDSPYFSINGFEPFLLLPNQKSHDIIVKFNYTSAEANCDTTISIVTNITSFYIRCHGLTGKITIRDADNQMSLSNSRRSLLQADLGKRYVNSIQNITFIIKNPNPVEFVVSKVKSTSGIRVDCQKSFIVKPDSEFLINCLILFKKLSEKKRSDQITFYGTGKSLLVTFSWIPVSGTVTVDCDLPDNVYYGFGYLGNISFYSTFNSTFSVSRLYSYQPSNLTIFDLKDQFILKPYTSTPAGNITFILNRDFIRSTVFENYLENEKNIKNLITNWPEFQQTGKLFIMLQVEPSIFLRATMRFNFSIHHRNDIEINIGKVVIGSFKNTTLAVPSYFYCVDHFTIFDNEDVKFEDKEFSLENDSIAIVNFLFYGKVLGSTTATIPITSNISAPFFAKISATIVDIKINVHPRELYFEPNSLLQRKIQKTIYITNKGDTEILLYNFTIRPLSWKPKELPYLIKTNCTVIIKPNSTCIANIIASSWKLINASFDFIVQSHMTRKTVRLRSTIGYAVYWKMSLTRKLARNTLFVLALAYPFCLLVKNVVNASKKKKIIDSLLKELPDEIERLSSQKSLKFSVATQAVGSLDSTGGVWVRLNSEHETDIPISNDLINAMKSALKKIE